MRKFILLAGIVLATNIMALSIEERYVVLTNANAELSGVAVYKIAEPAYCENEVEIWISAPMRSTRATFRLIDDSNKLIFSGSLAVVETIAEPIYASGGTHADTSIDDTLRQSQANYGFMSNGFRGVMLCLKHDYVSRSTIQFGERYPNELVTSVWDLGALGQWVN